MTIAYILLLALVTIGIANTVYLSIHAVTKAPVKCWWFPPEWCQKVQYSSWSKILGIPNSYAGLSFNVVILALLILILTNVFANIPLYWIMKAVITIGFLFSLYFTFIQAFVLKAFCTWCVLSAIDFTLLFVTMMFI